MIDWDATFAELCHTLHWTWQQAEAELDLHRLQAFAREWQRHPPVHWLVAAYMGHKPPADAAAPTQGSDDLATEIPDLMPTVNNLPPLDDSAWLASRLRASN